MGIVACVAIPNVRLSSGGTSVPVANGGGPVARVALEVVVAGPLEVPVPPVGAAAEEDEEEEEVTAGPADEDLAVEDDDADDDPCRLCTTTRWASPTALTEEIRASSAKTACRFIVL